ncbi:MAG: hypothetical protein D6784_18235 [Chloroflexi bacterium]|nr:MAG: hypothetical protein D6784_18235 [Chloroflexota bacterium]
MFTKKYVWLVLLLVAALAAMGVGYGLWFEWAIVWGAVETGEVDIGIENVAVTEMIGSPRADGGYDLVPEAEYVGFEGKGKAEVADCWTMLGAKELANPGNTKDDGSNILFVHVEGAYPSYHCIVDFDIKSLGNVPVHFKPPRSKAPQWVNLDCGNLTERQLHEGETAHCQLKIHFTNEDEVQENGLYCFKYAIKAYQFNEDASADGGVIDDCTQEPTMP